MNENAHKIRHVRSESSKYLKILSPNRFIEGDIIGTITNARISKSIIDKGSKQNWLCLEIDSDKNKGIRRLLKYGAESDNPVNQLINLVFNKQNAKYDLQELIGKSFIFAFKYDELNGNNYSSIVEIKPYIRLIYSFKNLAEYGDFDNEK